MKHSIRARFTVIFVAVMAVLIAAMLAFSSLFLEDYYIRTRRSALEKVQEDVQKAWESDDQETLMRIQEMTGVSILIIDSAGDTEYSSASGDKAENLRDHLFSYMFSPVTESKNQMEMQQYYDEELAGFYLECWGTLSGSDSYLISMPLTPIRESVQIFNRFIVIIGIACMALGVVAIYWASTRITKPIKELSQISEKMKELDFSVRYKGREEDEIGILGTNINSMSSTLEETISELKTANLNLQKDIEERRQIDEMRKDFVSNVSHELKTPIALIQGYAEGLKEGISDDPESREFYCDVIMDEAVKMNQMVKKLLTLNQLEFGGEEVELVRFDISELIKGLLASQDLMFSQKNAVVFNEFEKPIYVWGDEFKVEEVMTNYVSNAVNHLDGERVIRVYAEEHDNKVRIHVRNTGEQIPEDSLDKVWIKFYKVDKARTREYGGNGIGLSIVKAILDSFRQQCGVYNEEDGVNFWFELEKA